MGDVPQRPLGLAHVRRLAHAVLPHGLDVGNRRRKQSVCLMPIVVRLDVMLARRKLKARDVAASIGMAETNLSLLKSGGHRTSEFC